MKNTILKWIEKSGKSDHRLMKVESIAELMKVESIAECSPWSNLLMKVIAELMKVKSIAFCNTFYLH